MNDIERYRNQQVEELITSEGFIFVLKMLPSSVLESIDVQKFQTRPIPNKTLFVEPARVDEMVEVIKAGKAICACWLFLCSDKYIALDGRHRIEAHIKTGASSFPAYVIVSDDEAKINTNGMRLSNAINEMNGERAGNDEKEKNEKLTTINLCANEMFELYVTSGVALNDLKKEIPKKYLLHGRQITRATAELSKRLISNELISSGASTKRADDLVASIAISDANAVHEQISRAEAEHRLKLIETIVASKETLTSQQLNDFLKENVSKPATVVIESLRLKCGLNKDNKKMELAERSRAIAETDMLRCLDHFSKQLSLKVPFHGPQKVEVIKKIQKIKKQAEEYQTHLETN